MARFARIRGATADRYRQAVQRRVRKHGLKVICLVCDEQVRHKTHEQGRLRDRTCPNCGFKTLHSEAWALKHSAKMQALRHQLRKLAGMEP